MSYIDSNILPGEQVVSRATIHWIVFLRPVLAGFLAIVCFGSLDGSGAESDAPLLVFGTIFLLVALYSGLVAVVLRFFTEMAVTDRRVIAKRGFIRRDTIELNLTAFEGCKIDQSIMGRLLGYGTVTLSGRGGLVSPFFPISKPLEFRRSALSAAS